MAPLLLAALKFLGTAAASKAVSSAAPQYGMTDPQSAPEGQAFDLNALVAEPQQKAAQQEELRLQLQNRLPKPQSIY